MTHTYRQILSLYIVAIAVLFTGCAQFENRLSCTLDGKSVLYTSKYMNIGISSEVSSKDLPLECKSLVPATVLSASK